MWGHQSKAPAAPKYHLCRFPEIFSNLSQGDFRISNRGLSMETSYIYTIYLPSWSIPFLAMTKMPQKKKFKVYLCSEFESTVPLWGQDTVVEVWPSWSPCTQSESRERWRWGSACFLLSVCFSPHRLVPPTFSPQLSLFGKTALTDTPRGVSSGWFQIPSG